MYTKVKEIDIIKRFPINIAAIYMLNKVKRGLFFLLCNRTKYKHFPIL
jgi:hypothetical protein